MSARDKKALSLATDLIEKEIFFEQDNLTANENIELILRPA